MTFFLKNFSKTALSSAALGMALLLISCAGQSGGGSLGGSGVGSPIQNALDGGGLAGGQAAGGGKSGGSGDADSGDGDGDANSDGSIDGSIAHLNPLDAGNAGPIEAHPHKSDEAIVGVAKVLCREGDGEARILINGHIVHRATGPTMYESYVDYPAEGVVRFLDPVDHKYVEAEVLPYQAPQNTHPYMMINKRKNQIVTTISLKADQLTPKKFLVSYSPEEETAKDGEQSCPTLEAFSPGKRPCQPVGAISLDTFPLIFNSKSLKDYYQNPESAPLCSIALIEDAVQSQQLSNLD